MTFPLGAKLSRPDKRNLIFSSVVPTTGTKPSVFSLRQFQSPVVSQYYGTCVGFTGKDLKEYEDIKAGRQLVPKSGKGVYILCKQNDGYPNDEGTSVLVLLKVLRGIGIPTEADCPDVPNVDYPHFLQDLTQQAIEHADNYKIAGYAQLITLDDIKTAVPKYGNCPITIPVYEDYLATDVNGVIQQPLGKLVGYHEVSVIGWDDNKGLEIKNHWGNEWGDQGYAWLPYIYAGMPSFYEAYSVVDFITPDMKGAPVNLQYPVQNPFITQSFGARPDYYKKYGLAGHNGVDFRAAVGTNIYACDDGKVIFSGINGAYGNCIKIQHSWGVSIYGHLNDFVVADTGTPAVRKGQLIAHSDTTGDADGPHLHFGIKINGVLNAPFDNWVDPTPYFGDTMNLPVYKQEGNPAVYALVGQYLVPFTDMGVLTDVFPGLNVIELHADQFAKFTVVPALPSGKNVGIGIY